MNVYNPPSCFLEINNLEFLSRMNRLILCRDFNAHHGMWGSSQNNTNGRVCLITGQPRLRHTKLQVQPTFLSPVTDSGAFLT